MLTKFNLLSDNPFWSQLQQAQDAHVKSRDRYEDLLSLCQEAGVKFEDIKNYLLNQAKKVGLYRMNHKGKDGKPSFPPWGNVVATNWGFALNQFLVYKSKNYKDYGLRSDKVIKPNKNKPTILKFKRTAADGTVTEHKVEIEGVQNSKQAIDLLTDKDRIVPDPIAPVVPQTSKPSELNAAFPTPAPPLEDKSSTLAPIDKGLSKVQIQTIILSNFSILGEICREKGALEEFNLLMDALGVEEEMIIEIPSLENKYSSVGAN